MMINSFHPTFILLKLPLVAGALVERELAPNPGGEDSRPRGCVLLRVDDRAHHQGDMKAFASSLLIRLS